VPLTFRAEPAPSLAGLNWNVTGFNNGRQPVVGPVLAATLTLQFRDGTVQGSAGCNTCRAAFTGDGDRLVIGPAATTRKACAGEGVMQQEREFLAALGAATTWALHGGLLGVHRADGQRVLTASGSAK
jgi:heat shock protein HslJ